MQKKILVTAGPTWVPIDKVRIITNIFTGRLGGEIVKEALKRKMKVTLLLGPRGIDLPRHPLLKIFHFKFFDELYKLMRREISSKRYDIVFHSAAVSDFKVKKIFPGKISSQKKEILIKLVPTVKIIDKIKKWDKNIFLVKFKLYFNLKRKELIERGYKNLVSSCADLLVVNDLKDIKENSHKAFIIDKKKSVIFCRTKKEIAKKLIDKIYEKGL